MWFWTKDIFSTKAYETLLCDYGQINLFFLMNPVALLGDSSAFNAVPSLSYTDLLY